MILKEKPNGTPGIILKVIEILTNFKSIYNFLLLIVLKLLCRHLKGRRSEKVYRTRSTTQIQSLSFGSLTCRKLGGIISALIDTLGKDANIETIFDYLNIFFSIVLSL